MDFTPVIALLWSMLSRFIPAALLLGLLKSFWAKGHIGEVLARLFAHWQLDKQTYCRLQQIALNAPDRTTQIDHVLHSSYGIFVLETKNMSGWSFESEKQAQWTQNIYKCTFKFQYPLRQNHKYIKALEATLGANPEHLHSVINFVSGSTFKIEMPANVTQGIGFIRYIKPFQQPLFSEAEVDAMLKALQIGCRAPTLATHRGHVQNLKRLCDPTTGAAILEMYQRPANSHCEALVRKRANRSEVVRCFPSAGRSRAYEKQQRRTRKQGLPLLRDPKTYR